MGEKSQQYTFRLAAVFVSRMGKTVLPTPQPRNKYEIFQRLIISFSSYGDTTPLSADVARYFTHDE